MQPVIIHIDKLYKKYKASDYFSVEDFTLSIQHQAIFGLLGPNGAGKTTLISMLCGLIKPTSGTFSIHGLTYQQHNTELRSLLGVVPQEYALYPTLTAHENLMYFGSMYGLKGKELRVAISSNLERLGLLKFAHQRIETFSGGMKRRVNLIAGIMHQPKVLFLDEPTVGVDVQSRNVIVDFLKELNQNGATILYTSHHLLEAQDLCTHIAIIDNGRLFTEGTPKDLIKRTVNARSLEDVFIAATGKQLRDGL